MTSEIKHENIFPVVILVLFMVVGFIGNLHVVLVYAFRLKPTNHGIFIIFLSIQDISTCTILIPLAIEEYINQPGSDIRCSFQSFMMVLIHTGSAFTLLLVAIDRYRKICVPHGWQIKNHIAKRLCFFFVVSACFCSWPVFVLYEVKTVSIQNTTKTICGTIDGKKNYQLFYLVLVAVMIFGSLFILVFLYACVLRAVSKYHSKENVECDTGLSKCRKYQVLNRSKYQLELTTCSSNIECIGSENMHDKARAKKESSTECSSYQIKPETAKVNQNRRKRARKITLAFILISVFYCITYIPYTSLKIALAGKPMTLTSLVTDVEIVFGFVFPFLNINSIANCFIYSCFDRKFRNEIGTVYKRLCCRY